METPLTQLGLLLLIDTCGDTAGVALFCREELLAAEDLTLGNASAEIVAAVRRLLTQQGWQLRDLDAIGVVSGPGSFTGTRAGLATAKGLCEAATLQLAAVSRLEVLANAASLSEGLAVLDAGRNQVYVRDVSTGREFLSSISDLNAYCPAQPVGIAEARLQTPLEACHPSLHPLHAADALTAVLRTLRAGASDVSLTDANYVRQESDIYRKPPGATA